MANIDLRVSLEERDSRFLRNFARMNTMWLIISVFALFLSAYIVLSDRPAFLHDWHGVAIVALSLAIIAIYRFAMRCHRMLWPRPLGFALLSWGSIYLCILLLTFIDDRFAYDLYIAFGIAFALFSGSTLIAIVCVVFVTICAFSGLFTWPLTALNILSIGGNAVGFFAMTAISMMSQYLTKERYERSSLLLKLTQAHSELEKAHQKLAESATQQQELAVLRERTRLAREMHDTLGHSLVLVSVKLEAAQRLRERDPQRCDRELEATKEIVRGSMKELRASIANLRSPTLEYEPACRAISRYAREMALRAGLHVTYDLHPDIEGLPEQIEESLWKVGQEALMNVEKHAQAKNVVLHISRQECHILMRIQDDGIGVSPNLCTRRPDGRMTCAGPEGHYGLHGMVERVESLGGRFSLRPGQEHGTTIEVELPLVETPF